VIDHVTLRVSEFQASKAFDNGPRGERKYHKGYYAALVLDPDGNNVEAVFHDR
jgi:hypothetical protein